MGVFSLATNYLACVDYIKYLQNHMNTFQNEILALCPGAALPIVREKPTSSGLLKAIAALQLIEYIIAVNNLTAHWSQNKLNIFFFRKYKCIDFTSRNADLIGLEDS